MPTSEDWSYAAGIIDGEGCISIGLSGGVYHASVSVTMRHPEVIDWLNHQFGGFRYTPKTALGEMHRWELRNKTCKSFIEEVRHKLKLKGKQAGFLLLFIETIGAPGGNNIGGRFTGEEKIFREKIYLTIKKLNEKRKRLEVVEVVDASAE